VLDALSGHRREPQIARGIVEVDARRLYLPRRTSLWDFCLFVRVVGCASWGMGEMPRIRHGCVRSQVSGIRQVCRAQDGVEKAYALVRYVEATPGRTSRGSSPCRTIRRSGRRRRRRGRRRRGAGWHGARGAVATAVRHEGARVVRIDVPVALVGRVLRGRA
jgi:hypothetical protein